MISEPNELLKNPLFQLNVLLWMAQPLPEDYGITPLLYRRGFTVYAIAPLLPLPPDVRLATEQVQMSVQAGARPDVVLTQESARKFAFAECKASSFGPTSSTAEQARTLLIVAGPRAAEVLGLASGQVTDSLLTFVIPDDQRGPLAQTLADLHNELGDNRLPVGQFSLLGLLLADTDIEIVLDELGSCFFTLASGATPFMKLEEETDPRPLYFIPYDPDVGQSEQERVFCKRVLFERMHSTIVSAVGRANPPAELLLESRKILNDAMFGMYGHWENRESEKHMRGLCMQFMGALARAVNSVASGSMAFQPGEGWKVSLQNPEQQDKVVDGLTRFSCETLDLGIEPPPDLFDDLGQNTSVSGAM